MHVNLDVNLDVKGQIALRYDSGMKNKAVLVGAILVAIFVATVATIMVVRDERERAGQETQQQLSQVREEREKLDRSKTEAQQQTKSLTDAVDASKQFQQSQREKSDRINRVSIALTTTQQFKIAVAEHHQSTGQWPASNKDVGLPLPESFRNEIVRSVVIEPYGATSRIRARFVDAAAKERELQLIVSLNASTGYTWQCFSPDFPSVNELAAGCSYRATGK